MILGFKQKFADGTPTYFREKILAGAGYGPLVSMPKIHTIRAGDRWRAGMSIQMAYGVRTKNYEQFNKGITELSICKSVQKIKIITDEYTMRQLYIDGLNFNQNRNFETLAINDGFSGIGQFWNWFDKDFEGQIIHWTDYRY